MKDQPDRLDGSRPFQMPEDPDLWHEDHVPPEIFEMFKPKLTDPKIGTIMVYGTGGDYSKDFQDWKAFNKIFYNPAKDETTIQTSETISGQQKEVSPDKFDH